MNDERILLVIPWVVAVIKGTKRSDRKWADGCLIITTKMLAILPKVSMGKCKKDGIKEYVNSSSLAPIIPFNESVLHTLNEYSIEDFHKDLTRNEKHRIIIEKSDFVDATQVIKKILILWRDNYLKIDCQHNLECQIFKYKDNDGGRELEVHYDHGSRNTSKDEDYEWNSVVKLLREYFV
jgi:hypothetical protein